MKNWLQRRISRILCLGGLLGLWVVDVANSNSLITNGFWIMDSEKAFHIGIWVAIIAFLCLILLEKDRY